MARPSKLAERKLIAFVESGEWEIDRRGRIWRVAYRTGDRWNRSFRIVPCERRRVEHRLPSGHLQARAIVKGRRLYCSAGRLVWQSLHGDIPPGHEIWQRNGVVDDNCPANLFCRSDHPITPKDQWGERNTSAKLTNAQVVEIRKLYRQGKVTTFSLAKRFGVRFQHISRIVRGQRRPKQSGRILKADQRHSVSDHDPRTGRFIKTRRPR